MGRKELLKMDRNFYQSMKEKSYKLYVEILDYARSSVKSMETLQFIIKELETLHTYLEFEKALKK